MEELNLNCNLSPELYLELMMLFNINSALHNNFKMVLRENSNEGCFIYTLDKTDINSIKDIKIYGLFGSSINNDSQFEDYLYMEVGVKLLSSGTPLEIKTINAGKLKRCGRGSAAIRFLEEILIPELNGILLCFKYSEKIRYIYGISAELSPDTNALARAKFYNKNGFIISHSHFYKYL